MTAIDTPVSTAWIAYSTGATNRKEYSIGSVTPVTNEVRPTDSIMPATSLRRCGLAQCAIASAAAGSANIMIGKKPGRELPRVRVARQEPVDVTVHDRAVRLGEAAELEPDEGVQELVQADHQQRAVGDAEDARRPTPPGPTATR